MKRVLFYCQHVLGMGHLMRSLEIVRGLNHFEVCFLNGGELAGGVDLPANVRVINLPVLQSDEDFRDIHSATGEDLETVKSRRAAMLLDAVADFRARYRCHRAVPLRQAEICVRADSHA